MYPHISQVDSDHSLPESAYVVIIGGGIVGVCTAYFLATGFSGHGFGVGPGAGHLMADLITGDQTLVSAAPFRFERFAR